MKSDCTIFSEFNGALLFEECDLKGGLHTHHFKIALCPSTHYQNSANVGLLLRCIHLMSNNFRL